MELIVIARCFSLAPILGLLLFASNVRAQVRTDLAPIVTAPTQPDDVTSANPVPPSATAQADEAARQLRQQERQRIFGLIPNFNTTELPNAAPLSREQKFQLVS
jgi:hypothetical protein